MIEETATVVGLDDEYAIVETERRAACGSCDSAGSCSTSVLSGLFKRRQNQFRVLNTIHARPGQQVIIGLQESAFLKVSAAAYLLPLIGMLGLAIACQVVAGHLSISAGELPAIVGGLLGFMIGLFLFKRISGNSSGDPAYQAKILRQAGSQSVGFV
jgi:sigma-E factor negative regulatory protein RseC